MDPNFNGTLPNGEIALKQKLVLGFYLSKNNDFAENNYNLEGRLLYRKS